MIMSLVLISGLLLAAGLCCLVVAFARPTPRLEAALEQIERRQHGPPADQRRRPSQEPI